MLLVGSALNGYAIAATDGRIGTVRDLLFDDRTWKVRWAVVDTGTWLAGRKVLVHPSAVDRADHEHKELAVQLTRQQVENSPSILEDEPVSMQMESHLHEYYGWDPLWGGSYFGAGAINAPVSASQYFGSRVLREETEPSVLPTEGDQHLCSAAALSRCHIHATDGTIGHVENVLIDDADWCIHYLIVDTKNWWPGKRVLVSPYAVRSLNWLDRTVELDVTREKVRTSPAWDPLVIIDQYYQKRLHRHYGWPGYGW